MLNTTFRKKLDALFDPSTVAVIGASANPDKLGFHVMKSLTQGGYRGRILPVNPTAKEIMGMPACPALSECNGRVDLAIIVVPAPLVLGIFEQCVAKDVQGIVLITAGFKEIDDPAGGELQDTLAKMAHEAAIPVIGPNTFGMINLHKDVNASFTPEFSRMERGNVALLSQSGGISHLLAFMSIHQNVGISKIVGLGNRLNVDFAEVIPYLMEDEDTNVIVLYLEGLDNPRRFLEVAAPYRGRKPMVALKSGSARTGNRASLSHTGSLAGRQEIYEGALRQAGIMCAGSTEELLDIAHALSVCPPPEGPGIAVLTGQAGPGMAACDVCEAEGLQIVPFGSDTQDTINEFLPPLALRTNPVDMGPAWYNSEALQRIIGAVMRDSAVHGIILLMMFASANREAVPNLSDLFLEWSQKKPLITCLIAPPGIWDQVVYEWGRTGAIVNLPTPERASRAMAGLWHYRCMQGGPLD